MKDFAEYLCAAVKEFSKKTPHSVLKQIHVVDLDQKVVDIVCDIVQKSGVNQETPAQESGSLQGLPSQSSSNQYHPLDAIAVDDTCAICMDSMLDPVKLKKCGHTFCKECIDQQFKNYKPACPNCGVLYGVITGNMPTGGTMTVSHSRFSLPGYEHF